MIEEIKIVIIKHPNCGVQFVFQAPEGVPFNVGDYVLCRTKKSSSEIGRCITPAFWINEEQLLNFYGRTFKDLKPVVGKMEIMMFDAKPEEE